MTMIEDIDSSARAYIDAALEAQRQFGQPANISEEEYENAVSRVASAFEALARVRQQRILSRLH
jgi:hypothetical protein